MPTLTRSNSQITTRRHRDGEAGKQESKMAEGMTDGELKSSPRHDGADVQITRSTLQRKSPMPQERHQLIAEAAYRRAEQRGFEPGYELSDWLAAEAEVDAAGMERDISL